MNRKQNKQQSKLNPAPEASDMFRLSKSKAVVDLAPNSIRKMIRQGLRCYKWGRAVFVSKAETLAFIRNGAV
jgi:hypothetical protein